MCEPEIRLVVLWSTQMDHSEPPQRSNIHLNLTFFTVWSVIGSRFIKPWWVLSYLPSLTRVLFSYLSHFIASFSCMKAACRPPSSSLFSFLSTGSISSSHLLFLNHHTSFPSGPWESDFRRRDGRPFGGGEKKRLWMAECRDALHLLMWCNCLLLSCVILSPPFQAECQRGYE